MSYINRFLAGALPDASYHKLLKYVAILLPNIVVAPVRYFVADESKEVRKRMFYRDSLAGVLGVGVLYTTMAGVSLATKKKLPNPLVRETVALLAGWCANVGFQSVGAVKLSEKLSKKSAVPAPTPTAFNQVKLPVPLMKPLSPVPMVGNQPATFITRVAPRPVLQPIFSPVARV